MEKLLSELGYTESPHHKSIEDLNEAVETAHLFRMAKTAKVKSIYLFETNSPENAKHNLPPKPAVYIAEASTPEQARNIHRNLWNLNFAPFILIKLPNEIRVYTGFSYSEKDENEGLLESIPSNKLDQAITILKDISAASIDAGLVWKSQMGENLDINRRVDQRLLKNLRDLGRVLEHELPRKIAHAIIGKYVYIMYLRHREILTNEWLSTREIDDSKVFSHEATLQSLQEVINALELQFNGKIFPLDFAEAKNDGLADRHISWVASIFNGGEIKGDAPGEILRLQLHLDFPSYKFNYIPIETLSAIYEQFIDNRKEKGAVYTPEYLADFVLSEVETVKKLDHNGKIFDPACGSGVFLVLAYRRLIEKEIAEKEQTLDPVRLKQILEDSIYGVEREQEACYITEFSLILTLLHYVNPPHLHKLKNFKFPALHNSRIFHTDFFNINENDERYDAKFWSQELKFDWIIGNPPWASKLNKKDDNLALNWINNSPNHVARYRVAEAFSWLVTELLTSKGIVGFLLPATSLFNKNSKSYRTDFFQKNIVHKITNFANMRSILFGKGKEGVLPAISIIYQPSLHVPKNHYITHYAPFEVNQQLQDYAQPWTLTINANEISSIRQSDARNGNSVVWKLGLWGNFMDKNTLQKINHNLPFTINTLCEKYNWYFGEATQLRDDTAEERITPVPELYEKSILNKSTLNRFPHRFSVPSNVLSKLKKHQCNVRENRVKGLLTTWEPHIFISSRAMDTILYSEEDFVIPARSIGISAHKNPESALRLKALATYLNSSLVSYWLFFNVPQWGINHQSRLLVTKKVGEVPVPEFDNVQVQTLANYYDKLVRIEKEAVSDFSRKIYNQHSQTLFVGDKAEKKAIEFSSLSLEEQHLVKIEMQQLQKRWLAELDEVIYDVIGIPNHMQTTIEDFLYTRLPLDARSTSKKASTDIPSEGDYLAYAYQIQSELNEFVMGRAIHDINITISNDLIECVIESTPSMEGTSGSIKVSKSVELSKTKLMATFSRYLREQVSQWVYVRRKLRIYDNNRIYLYKSPRRIDWTRTQAMLDAQDIIAHILTSSETTREKYSSIA